MNGRIVSPQSGFGLVETLISLALTSLLILGVSQFTLFEMQQHSQINQHYFLRQQLSVALDILRQELLLAGYNSDKGESIALADRDELVAVNSENSALAFTYRKGINANEYQTVAYQKQENKLLLCEKTTSSILNFSEALASDYTSPCYSVFDSHSIQIDNFVAKTITLANVANIPKRDVLQLTISASLVADSDVQLVKTIEQPLGNWR